MDDPSTTSVTEGFGLMFYNARWYDPSLGRFAQADTIIPGGVQGMDRYAYVNNSPVMFTDPTGHKCEGESVECLKPDGSKGGGFTGGNSSGSTNKPNNNGGGSGNNGGGGTNNGGKDGDSLSDNSGGSGGGGGCNLSTLTNANGGYCHHTTYTPKQICFDVFECDPREQADYASRFQYPGQMPWNPIDPLADRTDGFVMGGDFMSDNYLSQRWLRELGAVYVKTNGSTMTNFTYKSHIFYEGRINRTVSDNHVTTVGYGTNANIVIAAANQYGGPIAFEINDAFMIAFSTIDQVSDGMLVELMNAIP